jgi:hypothetical protein
VRYGQTYRSCIYLEVVAKRGQARFEPGFSHLLLYSPDDCGVDVGADGLVSETVGHVLDGNWRAVGRSIRVGALYDGALYRRPRVLKRTSLMALAAVSADIAARTRNQK